MKNLTLATTLISLLTLIAASSPAFALVEFDFEQKFFNDPGQPVLDHCVVEEDGLYHLYYLRGNPAVSIGHATTTDFIHWDTKTPILSPGTWDNKALWAPYLLKKDDIWYMFYTGVNTTNSQQIGLAVANNTLGSWTKIPWPVYRPDTTWAEWTETSFAHGRDPHVVEYNGSYYLFATAKTKSGLGAVACAQSDNLVTWTDIGPVFVNTNWHVMESVFIMPYGGKWHMFFTEEAIYGTSHMSSDNLLSGWDMQNRRIIDQGHAPEVFTTSGGKQIFSRHSVYNDYHGGYHYNIRFDELGWVSGIPYPIKPWPLADNWTIISGTAFSFQPVFGNNPWVRNENVAVTYEGDCWIGTKEMYSGVIGYGSSGQIQGETPVGVMHSKTFSITGNSMTLLVGGSNLPGQCYVAMRDASTSQILFSETGNDSEEMTLRKWDLLPYKGRSVYIEIADNSDVGHINADAIKESTALLSSPGGNGDGSTKNRRGHDMIAQGTETATGVTALYQNSPNPFNPTTQISFELARPAHALLIVYDVNGRVVRTLFDGAGTSGRHTVKWDGRGDGGASVPSGIYFYQLSAGGETIASRKMILLK